MAYLTKEEKQELLETARSVSLRRDFENMRLIRSKFLKEKKLDADDYIEFATACNELFNHRPKKLKKITGRNFKL